MEFDEFGHIPWIVPYHDILAIAGDNCVELIEFTNCYGGAAWARYHYTKASPLITSSRSIGITTRYVLKIGSSKLNLIPSTSAGGIESVDVCEDTVNVTYAGLGGGGVGATMCRAQARDVIRYELTPAGGSMFSKGTLTLPKRSRVIIGVDDTDTKDEGATWSLVHNIASKVDSKEFRYLSHSIVQLYPVKAKTKNCVATVVEFASLKSDQKIEKFSTLLEKNTLSEHTGMVVLKSFDATNLLDYGNAARAGEVSMTMALEAAINARVKILHNGRGVIGAAASLPFFAQPDESIKLDLIECD
ncbi:MAG TPA: methanogenesis marker protein 11 [Candidatus Acidoferrales bacterium]|nr:methanogenesis marker protein 11 [Candidatus Acidoferrales bacterium]